MGWEGRQRGGRYYTRSRRVQGRVVREYFGAGLVGTQAARLDAAARGARQAERAAARAEQGQLAAIEQPVEAFCGLTDILVRASLLLAGYHRHGGEWRMRRGGK